MSIDTCAHFEESIQGELSCEKFIRTKLPRAELSRTWLSKSGVVQGRVELDRVFREPIDTGVSCPEQSCAVSYCSGPICRTTCSFSRVKLARGQFSRA